MDKTRRDLPIWRMAGLPVSQMVGQRTEVYPELKFRMEFELYSELDRLMRLILSGAVKPR
jgi:hypothetical protein